MFKKMLKKFMDIYKHPKDKASVEDPDVNHSSPCLIGLRDQDNSIPGEFLNSLGFIKYDHYGRFPWADDDAVSLSAQYRSSTDFLGIDCEMVGVGHYKTNALGRVSIVNEYGFCLYDTFVKPGEDITDYRTKYSGIRPEDLINAPCVQQVVQEVAEIIEGKYLVGHSIHNDLEVLRIKSHQRIRDTAMYFKRLIGSKATPSLKMLTTVILNMEIQGGEHSSIEDAQATMKLYLMHRDEWERSYTERLEKANLIDVVEETKQASLVADISEMHVSPREEDLHTNSKTVFLRPNKILGEYSSCEEYLDVQFRLMLEDFLRPLRNGVRTVKMRNRNGSRISTKIERLFYGVRIQGENCEAKGGKTLIVPIERNNLADIDWEESKIFMNGSLLLLTPDNFQSVKFAVVQYFNTEVPQGSHSLRIHVQFSKDGPSWITNENVDRFLMMESTAFYEAYKHTLEYLQVVKLNTFPMKKYIVDVVTTPSIPKYLRQANCKINFSVLRNKDVPLKPNESQKAKLMEFSKWPSALQLNLDDSQYEAVQKALTQELTIIQGPPGTGKTFIGVQICKLLLTNEWILSNTPILIVSYTNHSLDQTLELILHFITEEMCQGDSKQAGKMVLRIGGGSKSEIIQPLTLRMKQENHKMRNKLRRQLLTLGKALEKVKNLNFKYLLTCQGILNFEMVPQGILQELITRESSKVVFSQWKKVEKKVKADPIMWFGLSDVFSKFSPKPQYKDMNKGLFLLSIIDSDKNSTTYDKTLQEILGVLENELNQPMEYSKLAANCDFRDKVEPAITYKMRWILYFTLVIHLNDLVEELEEKKADMEEEYEELKYSQTKNECIKSAKVVGMTTTGAVKYKDLVNCSMKPKIMIVEEAAHVLEAHVVASLTKHCQQMIMIGDHKQLRPLTADYNLSEEYKLDVSLMERLVENSIAQNTKNWIQLKVQHRMRPEIARMVCPVIYEELENHPIVHTYPAVLGSAKNLYFVDHRNEEGKEKGSSSYFNKHEVDFVADLALFFVSEGHYEPSKITIIVTYAAQKVLLDEELKNDVHLCNIRICTVDGYQGEENDIILLSLVRSNNEDKVGFLKTNNRVCVALSRARHGLFMIGNMSCLKASSDIWSKINDILEEMHCIGTEVPFFYKTKVSQKRSEKSSFSLPACQIVDDEFQLPSNSPFESDRRPIIVADPTIYVPVMSSVTLACGHRLVPTPRQRDDISQIKCIEVVEKILSCGHKNKMHCHQHVDTIKCTRSVEIPMPCNHKTKVSCSTSQEKNCTVKDMVCRQSIHKILPCGHKLSVNCNQARATFVCREIILKNLPCGHKLSIRCHQLGSKSKRKKNSKIDGFNCEEMVKKNLPCGHTTLEKVKCSTVVSETKCQKKVTKTLDCGHRQEVKCCQKPSDVTCTLLLQKPLKCGHLQYIVCSQDLSSVKCNARVIKLLHCGHMKATCSGDSAISCDVCRVPAKTLPCGHIFTAISKNTLSNNKCEVIMESRLECGHVQKHFCHLRSALKCNNTVNKNLPCGHKVNAPCLSDVRKIECKVLVSKQSKSKQILNLPCHIAKNPVSEKCNPKCKKLFNCGHPCQYLSHVNITAEHQNYKCKRKCQRRCPNGHPCPGNHECYTNCSVHNGQGCKAVMSVSCGHGSRGSECWKSTTKDALPSCPKCLKIFQKTLTSLSNLKL